MAMVRKRNSESTGKIKPVQMVLRGGRFGLSIGLHPEILLHEVSVNRNTKNPDSGFIYR